MQNIELKDLEAFDFHDSCVCLPAFGEARFFRHMQASDYEQAMTRIFKALDKTTYENLQERKMMLEHIMSAASINNEVVKQVKQFSATELWPPSKNILSSEWKNWE
jgi:hypothetical protein